MNEKISVIAKNIMIFLLVVNVFIVFFVMYINNDYKAYVSSNINYSFSINNITVIIDDDFINSNPGFNAKHYVKLLPKNYFVGLDTIYFVNQKNIILELYDKNKQFTTQAIYYKYERSIYVFDTQDTEFVLLHELGHHVHDSLMSNNEQKKYKYIFNNKNIFLREYTSTNDDEGFADGFACYYLSIKNKRVRMGEYYDKKLIKKVENNRFYSCIDEFTSDEKKFFDYVNKKYNVEVESYG